MIPCVFAVIEIACPFIIPERDEMTKRFARDGEGANWLASIRPDPEKVLLVNVKLKESAREGIATARSSVSPSRYRMKNSLAKISTCRFMKQPNSRAGWPFQRTVVHAKTSGGNFGNLPLRSE